MKAAVLCGVKDIRLEDVEKPSISDREVLVKIKVALTCGTDAKVYQRGGHSKMLSVPSVFGHEWAGIVEEVGSHIKNFKKGDRVVAANSAPCFKCYYCKINQFSLCEHLTFLNGAYAEYIKVPEAIVETNMFQIPADITYEEAAFLEPLSCVVHGVEEIGVKKGDKVVISGAGPIGLLFLIVLKNIGVKVIVTEKNEQRLQVAETLGCDKGFLIKENDDFIIEVKRFFDKGADIAIEATGISKAWEDSVKMVRGGGRVLFFGGCKQVEKIELDTELVHYSQITMKGVFHHTPAHVKKAYDLIIRKKLNLSRLITDKIPLDKVLDAFEKIIKGEGIKIAVIP
ncbi:MAG: alcohol dehydrogenase catalytic domain-containing protein [Candidatus Omnitrophota bacterium]